MKNRLPYLLYLLLSCNFVLAQVNFSAESEMGEPIQNNNYIIVDFRADLEINDPAPKDKVTEASERYSSHNDYLDNAVRKKDTLQMIYGNLYLFLDEIRLLSYDSASDYLFEAIDLAEQSGVKGWQGWVQYRSGMLYTRTNQEEKALEAYRKGAELCEIAGDSLCFGESLEQLSAINALLGSYTLADSLFRIAMPLLRRFGSKRHIATAINNHGGLLSMRGEPAKAIPFFQEVIALHLSNETFRGAGKAQNNMADAYRRLEQYDKAIETYKQTIAFNKKYGFNDNIVRNYMGLYLCYQSTEQFQLANEYLEKRYVLRDSLVDEQTTAKINELQIKYETKETEAALERSESELLKARTLNERIIFVSILLALIIGFLVWRFLAATKHARETKEQNLANLKSTTKLLIEKNTQLIAMEMELSKIQDAGSLPEEITEQNVFDKQILTNDDWSEFKLSFEKSYPKYIMGVRNSFPSMTEGEERLFLMLKLNLTTKETAAILGISNESVKKNRYRLRKRLELESDESLEHFVSEFTYKRLSVLQY